MHSKLHLKLGGLLIVGGMLLLGMVPPWAQAAPPLLPTRPLPTATPTPTASVTPTPPSAPTITPPQPAAPETTQSSAIILEAQSTADLQWANLWTVIEQQTADGAWQVIEGWQGAFDSVVAAVGYKTWDVPPSLFGQGPFRWRVDTERSGQTLATSQPFTLPDRAGVRLTVVVTLSAVPVQPILLPVSGVSVSWFAIVIPFTGMLLLWCLRTGFKRR
jgi:hypothetical protein